MRSGQSSLVLVSSSTVSEWLSPTVKLHLQAKASLAFQFMHAVSVFGFLELLSCNF